MVQTLEILDPEILCHDAMLWGEEQGEEFFFWFRWASGVSGNKTRRHIQDGTRYF